MYVDYGNSEEKDFASMFELEDSLTKIPYQVSISILNDLIKLFFFVYD